MVSLWGRRRVEWRFLPSVGRSGGIIILWDPQVLELKDSSIGCSSVFQCVVDLSRYTIILFGVSLEFMVLIMTG